MKQDVLRQACCTGTPIPVIDLATTGGLAEWFNAPVLKTGDRESGPWVQIPQPPPIKEIK